MSEVKEDSRCSLESRHMLSPALMACLTLLLPATFVVATSLAGVAAAAEIESANVSIEIASPQPGDIVKNRVHMAPVRGAARSGSGEPVDFDVLVVIDVNREMTALREAKKLGIPTISLIDTDGDPDMVDIPIPGNDDSMRSIDVTIRELCKAVTEGKQQRSGAEPERDLVDADGTGSDRRRSRRAQYRADDATPAVTDGPAVAQAEPIAGQPAE